MRLRAQRANVPADCLLGGAVAVECRSVDPVDATRDRARQRPHLGRLIALDHDAARDAGAEGEFGHQQTGAPEEVMPHHSFLCPAALRPHTPRDSKVFD